MGVAGGGWRYLEPPLGLLFALNGQDESFASRQGEAQLVPLLASFLWDIDDVAQIQGKLRVGVALFDALVALQEKNAEFDVQLVHQIFKKIKNLLEADIVLQHLGPNDTS